MPGAPQRALITGSAAGIGAAVAVNLNELGYELILVDTDEQANNALAAGFRNAQLARDFECISLSFVGYFKC